MVELSAATRLRVEALFEPGDVEAVADQLVAECGEHLPMWHQKSPKGLERIRFAVLKLSDGDPVKLRQALDGAKSDWRDSLVAAGFGQDVEAHRDWFPAPRS